MATETHSAHDAQSETPKRTRIVIDVSPELRRRIRIAAAQQDMSIRQYLQNIIEHAVPAESSAPKRPHHPVTREAIERLNAISESISRAHPGVVFEDSAETVRQMREERSTYLEQL